MEQLTLFFEYIARAIEYIGIIIIAISALAALLQLFKNFGNHAAVRRQFAEWILTGLEFIIAAEIIFATLISQREELIVLGSVVLIRILLGYALRKEVIAH